MFNSARWAFAYTGLSDGEKTWRNKKATFSKLISICATKWHELRRNNWPNAMKHHEKTVRLPKAGRGRASGTGRGAPSTRLVGQLGLRGFLQAKAHENRPTSIVWVWVSFFETCLKLVLSCSGSVKCIIQARRTQPFADMICFICRPKAPPSAPAPKPAAKKAQTCRSPDTKR